MLASGGSQKVCYLGRAPSSSKFYRQGGSQKRSATSGDKRSYDQISESPRTRLASKVQTKDPKTRTKDQRTKGPEDQGNFPTA